MGRRWEKCSFYVHTTVIKLNMVSLRNKGTKGNSNKIMSDVTKMAWQWLASKLSQTRIKFLNVVSP